MSYVPVKKNAGAIFYMALVSQADTRLLKSSPTIAAGDFKSSLDGGSLGNLGTLPTVTPGSSVMVKVTLSAGETNGDNCTVVSIDAAGAEWCDRLDNFQTAVRQIDDLAFPATSGRSTLVASTGHVGIDLAAINRPLGQIPEFAIIDNGTAQAIPDATHLQLRAALAVADNELKGATLFIVSATTGANQRAIITGNVGATDTIAFDALATALTGTVVYIIFGTPPGSTSMPVPVMLYGILSTLLTEGAGGQLAAAFKQFFDVAAPSGTMKAVTAVGTVTGNVGGSVASVTGAVGSVAGLTASDVGNIKAKTDNLPSDPADQSLIIAATDAILARLPAALTGNGNIKAAVKEIVTTVVQGAGTVGDPWRPV